MTTETTPLTRPTCRTCNHFDPLNNNCHGAVPQLVVTPRGLLGDFPPTRESNWCAKHSDFDPKPAGLVIR